MSRPTKPQLIPPTTGQTGFGRAASQALLDLPNAMAFVDQSNGYQMSFVGAVTNTSVVAGDKAEQGISLATARRPLFRNSDGDGMTTVVPDTADDVGLWHTGITHTGSSTLGSALVFGHTLGYRFFELPQPKRNAFAQGDETSGNTVLYGGDRALGVFGEPTRDGATGALLGGIGFEYGASVGADEASAGIIIRLPEPSSVLITDRRGSAVREEDVDFTPQVVVDIGGGKLIFRGNNSVWRLFCEALDSPERAVPTRRNISSGLLFITASGTRSAEPGSQFTFSIGAFGQDDYAAAFAQGNGYDSADSSHVAFWAGSQHISSTPNTTKITGIRVTPTTATTRFVLNDLHTFVPIRVFGMQVQAGDARAIVAGAQN